MFQLGVDSSLVLTFVLDQRRAVFPIPGILFFPQRVHPASVLAIAMSMVNLSLTVAVKTPGQLGNAIGDAKVQVECVQIVFEG